MKPLPILKVIHDNIFLRAHHFHIMKSFNGILNFKDTLRGSNCGGKFDVENFRGNLYLRWQVLSLKLPSLLQNFVPLR